MSKLRSKQINMDSGLNITGSLNLSGSANFIGQTILKSDINQQVSLIVSGALDIVNGYAQDTIQQAKLTIGNLGTLGNTSENENIDLGGFF